MLKISLSLIALTVVGAALAGETWPPPKDEQGFEVMGIGGAGGMYTPSVSPYDSSFMLLSCDMSGCYRSLDGGKNWRMINYAQIAGASSGSRPFFAKDAVYWSQGQTLKVSTDYAKTWKPVGTATPWGKTITQIAALPTTPPTLLVGTEESGLWTSTDGGQNWQNSAPGRCTGIAVVGNDIFASVGSKVSFSSDGGKSWKETPVAEAQDKPLLAITGGTKDNASVLFAIAQGVGTLRSADAGKSWEAVHPDKGQREILMATNQTSIAYSCSNKDIFRTADGGKTWEPCLDYSKNVEVAWVQTELKWGYNIMRFGLGVNPADANTVFVSTQGDFYVSRDAGKSWKQLMNEPVGVKPGDAGFRHKCNGLEVTSTWEYVFDPFERDRRYIAYTDIGFARTVDGNETWIHSTKGSPWGNTFYNLVPDPFTKGRLFAAASNRHDIPHWTHITANDPKVPHHKGGVVVSEDYGATWKVISKGLPPLPCRYLCLDPKSTEGKLTFYVTVFGDGVYKSTDSGLTWTKKSNGLGNPGNNHAFMVWVHPKTGDVYCSVTALRKDRDFPVPGGLWKSTDGGENWTDITKGQDLRWPAGFAVHPEKPEIIYLTASTIPGKAQGGLYQTTDGGQTWKQLVTDKDLAKSGGAGFSHNFWVKLHPDNPDCVYLSSGTHGLWVSTDAGAAWKRFERLPFGSAGAVTFDPKDTKTMYVATFGGGVWKGKHLPEP